MKMSKEHFELLKSEIDNYLSLNPGMVWDYENGNFIKSDKVKILQVRFCWDLYWKTSVSKNPDIYLNYTDKHIQTALNKICPKVKRKY